MKSLIILAAVGIGGYLLFAGKPSATPKKSTPKTPGPGPAAVKVTYRTASGQQDELDFPPVNLQLLNDEETRTLAEGSANEIYDEAIGSNHPPFVSAAAARLATMNDPRAITLATQSIGVQQ